MDEVEKLYNEMKGNSKPTIPGNDDITSLYNELKGSSKKETNQPVISGKDILDKSPLGYLNKNVAPAIPGIAKGMLNVGNTLSMSVNAVTDTVDRLFKNPNRNLYEKSKERISQVNKLYTDTYGDTTAGKIGEVGGELLASAPLIPAGAITSGARTLMGAMPTVLSTGEKIAAPMVNRLAASSATGAIAGSAFGALTSAGNENSLAENVGMNALGGAVGGPIIEGAGKLASKAVNAIGNAMTNSKTAIATSFANKYGISLNAAKRTINELENEGMSLAEAEAQLIALGKNSTIGDLTPGLQKFIGALGQRGGRTTAVVENRYANRAANADDEAKQIMESTLGPKPDVRIERGKVLGEEAENIHNEAQQLTSKDYDAAKLNSTKLSLYSLIGDINKQLQTAVGTKATVLKEVKGYLYKTTKDAKGNDVKSIKNSVEDLHEIRIGIDDIINNRANSLPPNALRSVKQVRDKVNTQLKSIPEMASADTKFAEKMQLKEALKTGYEALTKGNKETFEKVFTAASPELQDTIRKGMRAAIGDMMEKAAKGELAGAQQLFKKRTVTRDKLVTAFGVNGEAVLDALAKQAVLRRTEAMAAEGSRSAINLRINALLDNGQKHSSIGGIIGDTIKGVAIDLSTGAPGAASAVMAAKRGGGNIINKAGQVRNDANIENFADLVSRSGPDLHNSLKLLRKVDTGMQKISNKRVLKLPIALSGPTGLQTYEAAKDIKNKLEKLY